jgi:hypothetical protein
MTKLAYCRLLVTIVKWKDPLGHTLSHPVLWHVSFYCLKRNMNHESIIGVKSPSALPYPIWQREGRALVQDGLPMADNMVE